MSPLARLADVIAPAMLALSILSILGGCAASTAERVALIEREGGVVGFAPVRYGANPPLTGMLRNAPKSNNHATNAAHALWIVIEGDGRAWLNLHQISSDPTPIDAAGWRLAKNISAPDVLYLARPCQFLSASELAACSTADWADARFSEKWVARMNDAIDAALDATKATPSSKIVLSGYSGGGVMAALIAARRSDVLALIAVAAPLDHAAWTAYHGVSPLSGSLSVVALRDKLLQLPQLLIAGADDDIVPPALMRNFLRGYPAGVPAEMITLPGVDHRMRASLDLSRIGSPVFRSSTSPWRTPDDRDNDPGLPGRSRPK